VSFVSGELNEETAKLMATPRCGVKDKVGPAADGRSKRYALQGEFDVLWAFEKSSTRRFRHVAANN